MAATSTLTEGGVDPPHGPRGRDEGKEGRETSLEGVGHRCSLVTEDFHLDVCDGVHWLHVWVHLHVLRTFRLPTFSHFRFFARISILLCISPFSIYFYTI